MKITIYRATKYDRELFAGMPNYEAPFGSAHLTFTVPDKEGYTHYDPYLKKYYNQTYVDNYKVWTDDETGETCHTKATHGWFIKTYEDGTVVKTEPKIIP